MIEIIVAGGIAIVTSTISAWVTYLCTRKKYNAEIESLKTENDKGVLDYYQDHSDYIIQENKRLREEKNKLVEENQRYMEKNFASKQEIIDLTLQVKSLTEEIKYLKEHMCGDHVCKKRKPTKQ